MQPESSGSNPNLRSHVVGKRGFVYRRQVIEALRKAWITLDCISAKRLSQVLSEIIPILERHSRLCLDHYARQNVRSMSPATMGRRLVEDRLRLDIKVQSRTKPCSLSKCNIPIKTFSD